MTRSAGMLHTIVLCAALLAAGCGKKGDDSNPCDGVTCSNHGMCIIVGGSAACDCYEGYRPVGLSCIAMEEDADDEQDAPADMDAAEDSAAGEPDSPPDGDDTAADDQPAEDMAQEDTGGEDIGEEETPVIGECEKAGIDVRVTSDETNTNHPSITFSGSRFGLAWEDAAANEIYFARLNEEGDIEGSIMALTGDAWDSYSPSLVFNDGFYAVAWINVQSAGSDDELFFTRFNTEGIQIGGEIQETDEALTFGTVSLTPAGSGYAIAWSDNRDGGSEIYFALLDTVGVNTSTGKRITNNPNLSYEPSLAYTGSEYGVAWTDSREGHGKIYFARIDGAGTKIDDDVRISFGDEDDSSPSLVFAGTQFGIAWADGRSGTVPEIYFSRIGLDGVKEGGDIRISPVGLNSGMPSLVFSEGVFAVAWSSDVGEMNTEIYFARLDEDGMKAGSDVRITNDSGLSGFPVLAATGSGYGVAWSDNRDEEILEIYFSRITCDL
ncbi:MAG: calcium-binding EGF-like domain-containing protein [Pseudomonadota bacterium]